MITRFWKSFLLVAVTLILSGTINEGAITLTTPGTLCTVSAQSCSPAPITSAAPTFMGDITNPQILNDPSITNLGVFVVPGTVVLCEVATSVGSCLNSPVTQWSDVLLFFDLPNGGGSAVQVFADLENGVVLLPAGFALSANAVSILEQLSGTGNDAIDFTDYTAGNQVYRIHSDAINPEIPDPETPEPSTLVLLGSGLAAAGLFRLRRTGSAAR